MSKREDKHTWTADEVLALGVRTDVPTAGEILGLGRSAAYRLAKLGQFPVPVIAVGAWEVVPVAPIVELLGIRADRLPLVLVYDGYGAIVGVVDPCDIIPLSQPDIGPELDAAAMRWALELSGEPGDCSGQERGEER